MEEPQRAIVILKPTILNYESKNNKRRTFISAVKIAFRVKFNEHRIKIEQYPNWILRKKETGTWCDLFVSLIAISIYIQD